MERKRLTAEALSGRQLSVAVLVAGLSPAAAFAGRVDWPWLLLWMGVGVGLGWMVLRRLKARPLYQGGWGVVLMVLYAGWAVLLAARALSRAAERLELTSGGSPKFWLLLIIAVLLVWMCWGKAAPFFRMVEILWLAMAVVLILVLVIGGVRVNWRYVLETPQDWRTAALAAAEILAPALFVLPYIYKVEDMKRERGLGWLAGLGGVSAALALVTVGLLGRAAEQISQPFFVAAGLLGKSARCEGLLSILWLLPDLTLVGLLCRVWGRRRWPALGAGLAAGLAATGVVDGIFPEIVALGTLGLFLLVLLFPGKKGKIVVDF